MKSFQLFEVSKYKLVFKNQPQCTEKEWKEREK